MEDTVKEEDPSELDEENDVENNDVEEPEEVEEVVVEKIDEGDLEPIITVSESTDDDEYDELNDSEWDDGYGDDETKYEDYAELFDDDDNYNYEIGAEESKSEEYPAETDTSGTGNSAISANQDDYDYLGLEEGSSAGPVFFFLIVAAGLFFLRKNRPTQDSRRGGYRSVPSEARVKLHSK